MCTVLLPPGGYVISVKKDIYHIIITSVTVLSKVGGIQKLTHQSVSSCFIPSQCTAVLLFQQKRTSQTASHQR